MTKLENHSLYIIMHIFAKMSDGFVPIFFFFVHYKGKPFDGCFRSFSGNEHTDLTDGIFHHLLSFAILLMGSTSEWW